MSGRAEHAPGVDVLDTLRDAGESHLDYARADLQWIAERGLVRSDAGMSEYLSWDLPQAAARTYPYTGPDDLAMLMNWFSQGVPVRRPVRRGRGRPGRPGRRRRQGADHRAVPARGNRP